jgi:hypothetical protein
LRRGLREDTLHKARLGYAVRNGKPCIVIPWYDRGEGGYWRVSLRDITPDVPGKERYKNTLPGFSNDGMYLGDSLMRKLPTFLVEGELDALSLAQVAGDIVNVVATGSTGNARVPKWEGRLARMPAVLVAFDKEDKGEKAARYWLDLLCGVTPVLRYRPLAHDANEMLQQGYDVRLWIQAGLDSLQPQKSEAQAFYDDFCSRPNHYLRLRDNGDIGIGVPGNMSSEEFQQLEEVVCRHSEELCAILRTREG